jgi:hypothetical protein
MSPADSRQPSPEATSGKPSDEPHAHYTGEALHNPEVAHEHSDINVRTVLAFAVGLALVVALVALIVRAMFWTFMRQAAANDPQVSPLAIPAGQLPPEPRLQWNEHEPAGLKKFRATETATLDGWGWVDQKTGIARMPIEDAKKLLLQRGLPARSRPVDEKLGTTAPAYGEASGGRRIRQ